MVLGEKPGYRNRIAYLPEKPNFPCNINVRDLVNFVAKVKKVSKEEIYNYLSELNIYARKCDDNCRAQGQCNGHRETTESDAVGLYTRRGHRYIRVNTIIFAIKLYH